MCLAQWHNGTPSTPIGHFFQNFHIPILSSDFIYDRYLDFVNR